MQLKTHKQVAAAIEALDLSAENNRVDELTAEISAINAAITRADERRAEIFQELAEHKGPSPKAVGDALLSGASTADAALAGYSPGRLREEAESLLAGAKDLNDRMRDLNAEVDEIRKLAMNRAGQAVQPLVDELTARTLTAAETILESFAALSAVNVTCASASIQAHQARVAVDALMGAGKPLPFARSVDVPGEIADLLALFADKGPSMQFRTISQIATP